MYGGVLSGGVCVWLLGEEVDCGGGDGSGHLLGYAWTVDTGYVGWSSTFAFI